MKKRICFSFLVLFVLAAFSCATKVGVVFDELVPVEQSTWISSSGTGTIIAYNEIPVDWKIGIYETIQIPAGDTLLEWNVEARDVDSATLYRGNNILIRYNFRSGKKYFFMFKRQDGAYGFNIYQFEPEEKISVSMRDLQNHLVDFAPFLNVAPEGSKTILK